MRSLYWLALPALLIAGCEVDLTGCEFYDGTFNCGSNGQRPPENSGPTTFVLSAPRTVVGEATYDPVQLWGSRCEVTVAWQVNGPSSVLFDPGSTITWTQINDEGRSDPLSAPWDPVEFFGTQRLQPRSSGSVTRTWTGGNDGNHPDSAPFWDATVAVRYHVAGTSQPLEATFSVECLKPAPGG